MNFSEGLLIVDKKKKKNRENVCNNIIDNVMKNEHAQRSPRDTARRRNFTRPSPVENVLFFAVVVRAEHRNAFL